MSTRQPTTLEELYTQAYEAFVEGDTDPIKLSPRTIMDVIVNFVLDNGIDFDFPKGEEDVE